MKIFTISEIAELIGKSQKTIRREIHSNKLKATKVQNKFRIYEDDLNEWMKNKKTNNTKPQQKSKDLNKINFVDISDLWNLNGWENKNDMTKYNFIDLFSGAGGLSLGLVMAGFNPVATVEIMPEAVETYKYNFIEQKKFDEFIEARDIRSSKVKKDLYHSVKNKEIHLIVGGFPCQGFSMSGYRVVEDPRNSLYKEMKEIINYLKPQYIIMENVLGLRSMLNGKLEQKILNDFRKIGYNIEIAVLNSADYKVPQIRKRVVFIGNRIGVENFYPMPLLNEEEYITLGAAIEKYQNQPENKDFNHVFTKHSDEMKERLEKVPEGKSLYKNYSDSWKKSPWGKPSCTIKENHGGTNIHPKLPRTLTARELASLQSFPDDFIFKGSKKWQLVQIGNAVPPLMAKAVGLAVRKQLEKFNL